VLEAFISEIDARWASRPAERIVLRVIGSTALMLQANYVRGTKDSDVFRTGEIDDVLATRLLALAGPGTDLHERHHIYLELVPSAILFQRQTVQWHPAQKLNATLQNFHIELMSITDVIVSKLKRLHSNDMTDIEAVVERGLLSHTHLISCFREAVDFTMDAKAVDLPRYRANLHRVERDLFGVDTPTEIELPQWVENA